MSGLSKRWSGLGLAALAAAVGLWGTAVATAAELPAADPPRGTPLFNGTDLQGWQGDARVWTVRDGVIRGESAGAAAGAALAWSGGEVADFALAFEFRVRSGTAAVQVRARAGQPAAGYRFGLASTAEATGGLWREPGQGQPLVGVGEYVVATDGGGREAGEGVVTRDALLQAGAGKPDDWRTARIVARGNNLVHYVQGRQVAELVDNDTGKRAAAGQLALCVPAQPGTVVEFRNLRLEPFTSRYGNAVSLFNSRDLDGWTPSSDGAKAAWGVKDGVITDAGQPGGYLRTTADYTNYVLRLQFRHLTDGNSGVLLRIVGPDRVWPRCVEAQGMRGSVADIFAIDDFPIGLDPARAHGRYSPKLHPSNEGPLGQWNQYEITFDGGTFELRVNDLLQNTGADAWETPGKIALQAEGGRLEFRRLTLVPILRPAPTAVVLDNGRLHARCERTDFLLTVIGGYRTLLRDWHLSPRPDAGPDATLVPVTGPLGSGQALELRHPSGLVERLTLGDRFPALLVWNSSADPTRCVLALGGDTSGGAVPLEALGLPKGAVGAGFDRGGDRFLGPLRGAFPLAFAGDSGRLLSLVAVSPSQPVAIDTSAGPLVASSPPAWDAAAKTLAGRARLEAGQPYQLHLFAPPQPLAWIAKSATVAPADAAAGVRTEIAQARQWLRVTLTSPAARTANWQVAFAAEPPQEPEKPQIALKAEATSPWSVRLTFADAGHAVRIVRDGQTELPPGASPVVDDAVNPDTTYTYAAVVTTWAGDDVTAGTATVKTPAPPPLPPAPDVYLSDLTPVKASTGWGDHPRKDRSIEDNPIRIRRHRFDKGVGVHALSELVYTIAPDYARFVAIVGVDDEKNSGSVAFEVYADDKLLFKTDTLTVNSARVDIRVDLPAGAKQLRLVVTDGGDGIGCDHADWAYAGFARR